MGTGLVSTNCCLISQERVAALYIAKCTTETLWKIFYTGGVNISHVNSISAWESQQALSTPLLAEYSQSNCRVLAGWYILQYSFLTLLVQIAPKALDCLIPISNVQWVLLISLHCTMLPLSTRMLRWSKLRYESSTLILYKELSSPIFQSLSVSE